MTNYNDQHVHLIVDGLKAADAAEGTAVDEHRKVAVGIHRLLGTLNGKTSALRDEIKARIESLGPGDSYTEYSCRLCGRNGDKKSRDAATNLRLAYLWMAEFPEQLDWVLANTGARQPTTMHKDWKIHQSAIIKEGREAGSPPATISSRLLGTTPDAVKEVIDRAEKAEEKRKEKEQAQPEPAPAPTPDVNPIMVLRDWLLEANEKELDAVQTLIDERKARLGVSPDPSDSKGLVRFLDRRMREDIVKKLDILEVMTARSDLPSSLSSLVEGDDQESRTKSARILAKRYRDLIAKKLKPDDEVATIAAITSFMMRNPWGVGDSFPKAEAKEIATETWCRSVFNTALISRRAYLGV